MLEDDFVIVKFFTKESTSWLKTNTYLYECTSSRDLDPHFSDFNNDGYNDITFISLIAARGGNEVRRLFIYDKKGDQLISILNSEDYPNMQYNEELDCIDAFLLHGGSSTVFAKIKGDSLKTFARVDNDNYRTVSEISESDNRKIISKDTIINEGDVFTRYKNYKPLKAYKY
ncbi:hypothetical protein D3C80_1268210 [compost metagenome]